MVRHQGLLIVSSIIATLLVVHRLRMEIQPASLLLGGKLIAQLLIDEIVLISLFSAAVIHFLVVLVTVHGLARVLLRAHVGMGRRVCTAEIVVGVLRSLVCMHVLSIALEHY